MSLPTFVVYSKPSVSPTHIYSKRLLNILYKCLDYDERENNALVYLHLLKTRLLFVELFTNSLFYYRMRTR